MDRCGEDILYLVLFFKSWSCDLYEMEKMQKKALMNQNLCFLEMDETEKQRAYLRSS